jgi:hypothetical protein
MHILIVFLLYFIPITSYFRPLPCTRSTHLSISSTSQSATQTLSPRRALFFSIIEAGLKDKFSSKPNYEESLSRILKFCDYAKGKALLPQEVNQVKLKFGGLFEPCEEYIEGLTAQPWWLGVDTDQAPVELFPWVGGLAKESAVIAEELFQNLGSVSTFRSDSRFAQTMGTGWSAVRLQRFGAWLFDNAMHFPITVGVLKSLNIPLAVRGVMFAKQNSHTGVLPHSDGRNFILTAHVGLKVPSTGTCWIRNANIKHVMRQGQVIIFDTSFVHETMNDSDEDRYVLIIDFWHPELTLMEREGLEYIYDARNKFDEGRVRDIQSSFITSDVLRSVGEKEVQAPLSTIINWFARK